MSVGGFLLGGRLDKHNLLDAPGFQPACEFAFQPSVDLNFRASYSAGFRAPQAFDEDMHVSMVGEGKLASIRNMEGLKKEKSHSFSVSADWFGALGEVRLNLLAEGFYTKLNDVFALRDLVSRTVC